MGHKHLLVTVQCLCHNYFSCTLVPFSVLPFAPAFPAVSLQEFPFPPLGGCRLPAFLPFPSVCPPLLTPPSEHVYHTLLINKTLLSYPSREGQEKKPLFSWLNSGPCWSILPWGVNSVFLPVHVHNYGAYSGFICASVYPSTWQTQVLTEHGLSR